MSFRNWYVTHDLLTFVDLLNLWLSWNIMKRKAPVRCVLRACLSNWNILERYPLKGSDVKEARYISIRYFRFDIVSYVTPMTLFSCDMCNVEHACPTVVVLFCCFKIEQYIPLWTEPEFIRFHLSVTKPHFSFHFFRAII